MGTPVGQWSEYDCQCNIARSVIFSSFSLRCSVGGLPDVVRPIQRQAAGVPSATIHEWRPGMSTETNKQIARSFLQSVDDLDFGAWRAIAAPELVASANGGDVMNRDEFEGMVRGITGAFSNGRHIVESQVAEGDRVATR